MSKSTAFADAVLPNQRWCSVSALSLAILAFSLVLLPVGHVNAYPGGATLPTVGSLDDYVSQTRPRDQTYPPSGSYSSQGGQRYYGSRNSAYRAPMNPAVMGTMLIALWALERYQQRHHRHAAVHYPGHAPGRAY